MDHRTRDSVVENYALRIRRAARLCEGEGCNYRLVDGKGVKYVLKVYDRSEEKRVSFITTLLAFLAQSGMQIQVPRPVANVSGVDYTRQPDQILVMFHWIKGAAIRRVNARIAQDLGQAVGMLGNKLHEFYSAGDRTDRPCPDSLWNVTNVHRLDQNLQETRVLLGEHYGLIQETIAQFDRVYPALQNGLQKSLIHNDINLGNLLYDRRSNLTGIIDFTEACHTCRVCEAGVALAYLMQVGGSDYAASPTRK